MTEAVEFNALRALCSPWFADEDRERFFICLDQDMDWTALFQGALRHDVAPLVAHRLLTRCKERLPDDLSEGLTLYLEGEGLRGRKLVEELSQLLGSLNAQGIPAIPIKGPQLASALYGDSGLRSCRDLDILVRDADVARSIAALEGLGYRHDSALSIHQIKAVRNYGGQYILFHPERVAVEPHWLIAPTTLAFDLDYERLWQRAFDNDFQGVSCLGLTPEVNLLLLCLHGAKEQWQKLKWIADIAVYLESYPDIDWSRLYAEAAEQGCVRMLNLALALAQRLMGASLPAEATEQLRRDHQAELLASGIINGLTRGELIEPDPYRLSMFYWRMRERPRDRLTYAIRTLTTPRARHYGLLRLPPSLLWAYYPLKLLWDYLLIPIHNLTKQRRFLLRKSA